MDHGGHLLTMKQQGVQSGFLVFDIWLESRMKVKNVGSLRAPRGVWLSDLSRTEQNFFERLLLANTPSGYSGRLEDYRIRKSPTRPQFFLGDEGACLRFGDPLSCLGQGGSGVCVRVTEKEGPLELDALERLGRSLSSCLKERRPSPRVRLRIGFQSRESWYQLLNEWWWGNSDPYKLVTALQFVLVMIPGWLLSRGYGVASSTASRMVDFVREKLVRPTYLFPATLFGFEKGFILFTGFYEQLPKEMRAKLSRGIVPRLEAPRALRILPSLVRVRKMYP